MLDNGLRRYYITSGVCVQPPLYVHPASRIVQASGCGPGGAGHRFLAGFEFIGRMRVSERLAYVKTAFSVKNAHE